MKKEIDEISEFDFGFSFVDDEVDEVKKENKKLNDQNLSDKDKIKELEKKLELLHNSIVPFLDNLCKNPEKATIYWPNRVEKIKDYKKKLLSIKEGKDI